MSLLAQDPLPWGRVAVVGPASVAACALAVRHLLRVRHPLVDLRTLHIGTFRVAAGSGCLTGMAIGAVPLLLPLLFENVFGWSPVKSGAVVLFVFVGNIGIKPRRPTSSTAGVSARCSWPRAWRSQPRSAPPRSSRGRRLWR